MRIMLEIKFHLSNLYSNYKECHFKNLECGGQRWCWGKVAGLVEHKSEPHQEQSRG